MGLHPPYARNYYVTAIWRGWSRRKQGEVAGEKFLMHKTAAGVLGVPPELVPAHLHLNLRDLRHLHLHPQAMLDACLDLCRTFGPSWAAAELLQLCVKQVGHCVCGYVCVFVAACPPRSFAGDQTSLLLRHCRPPRPNATPAHHSHRATPVMPAPLPSATSFCWS